MAENIETEKTITSFATEDVMTNSPAFDDVIIREDDDNLKLCRKCNCVKDKYMDFYMCKGKIRYECKKCTIRRNVIHQRETEAWKHKFADPEKTKAYMIDYYSRNREKFAEYRKKFKEKYPDYYKKYSRKKKKEPV